MKQSIRALIARKWLVVSVVAGVLVLVGVAAYAWPSSSAPNAGTTASRVSLNVTPTAPTPTPTPSTSALPSATPTPTAAATTPAAVPTTPVVTRNPQSSPPKPKPTTSAAPAPTHTPVSDCLATISAKETSAQEQGYVLTLSVAIVTATLPHPCSVVMTVNLVEGTSNVLSSETYTTQISSSTTITGTFDFTSACGSSATTSDHFTGSVDFAGTDFGSTILAMVPPFWECD